jgi:ribosome-associated protein
VTTKKPSKKSSKHRPSTTAKKTTAGKTARKTTRKEAVAKAKKAVVKRRPVAAAPLAPLTRPGEARARRESLAIAKAIIAASLEKKAIEPVLIDVCGRASYADFIGVVSGRSDRQVDAIADYVCEVMAAQGRRPIGREGARNGRWALIDFGDVVLHVFYHPLREVFDIESLWIDAPRVKLQVPAEARADAAIGRDSSS